MRKYIEVYAQWDKEGHVTPLAVELDNEKRYRVERVVRKHPMSVIVNGGIGMRYTVVIDGRERHLYYDGRWWILVPGYTQKP